MRTFPDVCCSIALLFFFLFGGKSAYVRVDCNSHRSGTDYYDGDRILVCAWGDTLKTRRLLKLICSLPQQHALLFEQSCGVGTCVAGLPNL